MIFQYTWEKVLRDEKTQTRRIVKPGETLWCRNDGADYVADGNGRKKWQVGRTYAVQPGRGKSAVGRIKLTAIRKERVQDITEADAIAEGCLPPIPLEPIDWREEPGSFVTIKGRFFALWDSIHSGPDGWIANPSVWVLEFERVKEPEPA
jgi:hypothetical protein